MIRLKMKNFSIILIEKLQKYQPYLSLHLTGEEILPSNQKPKITYSPIVKSFEKQNKTI